MKTWTVAFFFPGLFCDDIKAVVSRHVRDLEQYELEREHRLRAVSISYRIQNTFDCVDYDIARLALSVGHCRVAIGKRLGQYNEAYSFMDKAPVGDLTCSAPATTAASRSMVMLLENGPLLPAVKPCQQDY